MIFGYRIGIVAFLLLVAIFWLHVLRPLRPTHQAHFGHDIAAGRYAPSILNATLGFEKVFILNLPERTDRRDAMTLSAAVSNIDLTWIDGVLGTHVPDKVLPQNSKGKALPKGNIGSWRAHMNALQRVIRENLTNALIMEDDVDWDIRLKSQLQVFAKAAQAFTQPSAARGGKTLAATHEMGDTSLSDLPSGLSPSVTPYGDNWDVLWLGHCGTEFPNGSQKAPEPSGKTQSYNPPSLRVLISSDPTVPIPKHLKGHPFALQDPLGDLYPPHTRVVHASGRTVCTQAYAVSQQGARKLLWQFGLQTLTTGWDLMLRDWCDGAYQVGNAGSDPSASKIGKSSRPPVCVTVQPPLFSHHFGKGAASSSDISAPGGGFLNKGKEMTPYIRLSVRMNLERLVQGVGINGRLQELVDQWPDDG